MTIAQRIHRVGSGGSSIGFVDGISVVYERDIGCELNTDGGNGAQKRSDATRLQHKQERRSKREKYAGYVCTVEKRKKKKKKKKEKQPEHKTNKQNLLGAGRQTLILSKQSHVMQTQTDRVGSTVSLAKKRREKKRIQQCLFDQRENTRTEGEGIILLGMILPRTLR